MADQARSAMRSSSFMHVDETVRTALDEIAEQGVKQKDDEFRALQQIASLENHPGWKIIKEQYLYTIDEYRSGRKLDSFLKDFTLSDAQIGQATRTMNLIADELTATLNAVMLAVSEVERHQKENKDATATRRMGPRT